jgi:signal transduction histidine kinase
LKRGLVHNKNKSGLGLGLYIAQEIAKAHGGLVQASSDQQKTVFSVELPRLDADAMMASLRAPRYSD